MPSSNLNSTGLYVEYQAIDNKNYIYEFLNKNQCFSNCSDFEKQMDEILKSIKIRKYRDQADRKIYINPKTGEPRKQRKRKPVNIFCHSLTIMVPKYLDENHSKLCSYISKIAHSIDPRYKKLLYIWREFHQGKGFYVELLCFTRYVFKKTVTKEVRYVKDTYICSISKKTCSAKHDTAIRVAKKGDVKKDKQGKPVTISYKVRESQERIFIYKSFKKFMDRLKKDILYAYATTLNWSYDLHHKRIKHKRMGQVLSISQRAKINLYNKTIDEINYWLFKDQDYLLYVDEREFIHKRFNHFYYRLMKMIKEGNKKHGVYPLLFNRRYSDFKNQIEELKNGFITLREEEWLSYTQSNEGNC